MCEYVITVDSRYKPTQRDRKKGGLIKQWACNESRLYMIIVEWRY